MKLLAIAMFSVFGAACANEAAPPPPTPLDPPAPGTGFQLDEGTFDVAAGEEGLYCMRLPVPASYGDGPLYVREIESRLPVGTHHFFMSYRTDHVDEPIGCFPDGAYAPVDQTGHDAGGGKLMFLSGEGEYAYTLPDGYAFYLPSAAGQMVTSHHVLNTGETDKAMYGLFNIHTVADAPHPINQLNCLLMDIWVAPHSEQTVSAGCSAPFDLDLVVLASHAHQHLKKFEITLGGETLYQSNDWDSPAILTLEQPRRMVAGDELRFACTFRNDGDQWISFGTGDYGEMCAIMSQYAYPVERVGEVPPSLGTIVYSDGLSAELVETSDLNGPF